MESMNRDQVLFLLAIVFGVFLLFVANAVTPEPTAFDRAVQTQLHIRGYTGFHVKGDRAEFDYPYALVIIEAREGMEPRITEEYKK